MQNLEKRLKELPGDSGVYFFKDDNHEVIYIGKAAILKNRVRQYFQKTRPLDTKTAALVNEIRTIDWMTVESEIDALFLEAEMVRRYRPKYNILLRDDKSTSYIRIDFLSNYPSVTMTRRPLDDRAEYFGPYFSASSVKKALRILRKIFPYSTHTNLIPKRACLQYHLGLCPGLEEGKTTIGEYKKNLHRLKKYIQGERTSLIKTLEKEMQTASKKMDYETATILRNKIHAIKGLSKQIVFSREEFLDISKDEGLSELAELLGLNTDSNPNHLLRRIEGYDISHMSGTDNVASMVVFINGLPAKTEYRKFKMRLQGNNDFAHMEEVIKRRLSPDNVKKWQLPSLFLIDGGKGQLSAALKARNEAGYGHIPMIGLAKREEEIVISKEDNATKLQKQTGNIATDSQKFQTVLLPASSHASKLIRRIRDESHRFAVSYHSVLKQKRQTASQLDEIPGIGPKTRQKLLRQFGSVKSIKNASKADLLKVVGPKMATNVQKYLAE